MAVRLPSMTGGSTCANNSLCGFPVCQHGSRCELCALVGGIRYVGMGGYGAVVNTSDEGCIGDVDGVVIVHGCAKID